jgi:Protein of unknown function (DUF2950)
MFLANGNMTMRGRTYNLSNVTIAVIACALVVSSSLQATLLAQSTQPSAQNPSSAAQQKTFAYPGQAIHILFAAAKAGDEAKLMELFGPDSKILISSGDPEEDRTDRQTFVEKYQQAHRLVKEPDHKLDLYIGAANWPFPIPLIEEHGVWRFDTEVGKETILLRRIGKNELSAIETCHELVAAEEEHYAGAHPGEAGQFAMRFVADNGEHNGLFHPVDHGQPEIGPLLARAGTAGKGDQTPFRGYYFRILTKQGSHAPGGAKDYIVDGKMTGGFAFVAYPAEYRSTGVMTLMVNQDGTVYEKNLGEKTAEIAPAISTFDPDSSWKETGD